MRIEFHLFVFAFVTIFPIVGYFAFRKFLRKIAAGEQVDRLRIYGGTMLNQWLLCVAGILLWFGTGRPWAEVGVTLPGGMAFWLSATVVAGSIFVLYRQLVKVRNADAAALGRYAQQIGRVRAIIPANQAELHRFYALSVTAGIVEEFLWRGILIWYLAQYVDLWLAATLSTVGFGLAHAYQGAAKMWQILLVTILFTALYLATGSLLLTVILHAAADILQGRLAYEVLTRQPPAAVAAESSA